MQICFFHMLGSQVCGRMCSSIFWMFWIYISNIRKCYTPYFFLTLSKCIIRYFKTWVRPGVLMPLTTFLIFLICLEQHNSIMDKKLFYGISMLQGTSFPLSPKTINNWVVWLDQICEEFCAFFFFFGEYITCDWLISPEIQKSDHGDYNDDNGYFYSYYCYY